MKARTELSSAGNTPRLIPSFKQNERHLLSIFMAVLDIVPEFRGAFFKRCNFNTAKTSKYTSFMEPQYSSPKYPEVRPDGIVFCERGQTAWLAFIEAKSGSGKIRTEQMQDYTNLANLLDVDAVISISNEFATDPVELPYHLPQTKRRKRDVFHFSWAELRTFIALFLERENDCNDTEIAILNHCLEYMWEKESGVMTYDLMPQDWPKFVESAGTALGFSSKTQGVTEIVHGWQQERRDLCAKIIYETKESVDLRHDAGLRADADTKLKYDKNQLANDYCLTATYVFKTSKASLKILAGLRSCKISAALEILPPEGKKAKACVNWINNNLAESPLSDAKVSFDWKGRSQDMTVSISELETQVESICSGQKEAPKKIRLIREFQDVRRFKSRGKFIESLEDLALGLVEDSIECELI